MTSFVPLIGYLPFTMTTCPLLLYVCFYSLLHSLLHSFMFLSFLLYLLFSSFVCFVLKFRLHLNTPFPFFFPFLSFTPLFLRYFFFHPLILSNFPLSLPPLPPPCPSFIPSIVSCLYHPINLSYALRFSFNRSFLSFTPKRSSRSTPSTHHHFSPS